MYKMYKCINIQVENVKMLVFCREKRGDEPSFESLEVFYEHIGSIATFSTYTFPAKALCQRKT